MSAEVDEIDDETTLAGFVRGASRSLVRSLKTVGKTLPGQLPIPKRAVAKGLDQLSTVVDMGIEVDKLEPKTDGNGSNRTRTSDGSSSSGSPHGKGSMGSKVLLALPNFLKTTLLGTALFEVYDDVCSYPIFAVNKESKRKEVLSSHAFIAGGASGAIHGILFCAWDYVAIRIVQIVDKSSSLKSILGTNITSLKLSSSTPLPNPSIVAGTAFSHCLVHSALFSSYVTLRNTMWNSLSENDRDSGSFKGIFSVAIAGGLSGMIAEILGMCTSVLEEKGIFHGMKSFSLSPRLFTSRQIMIASFPGSLGFLAYEFGKDVVMNDTETC